MSVHSRRVQTAVLIYSWNEGKI